MREEKIYIALDGKKFDNRLACLEYEKGLSLNEFKGVMLDKDFCPTNEANSAYYVRIDNADDLNIINTIYDRDGYETIPDVGCWVYSDETWEWVDVYKKIEYYKNIIDKLFS